MARKGSGKNGSGPNVSRRNFMAGVAVAGAATAVSPQNAVTAASSTPWTDTPLCCTCQPTNGLPSYSITSL